MRSSTATDPVRLTVCVGTAPSDACKEAMAILHRDHPHRNFRFVPMQWLGTAEMESASAIWLVHPAATEEAIPACAAAGAR